MPRKIIQSNISGIYYLVSMIFVFICSALLALVGWVAYLFYWFYLKFKLILNYYVYKKLGCPAERDLATREKAILRVH